MYSPKKIVSLCIALLGLAAIAVVVTTGTVGASPRLNSLNAAPPTPSIPVMVTNTPLPVSGSVTASLSGTPSVNVASLPAVQLSGGASVNVTSSSGSPVFVEEGYSARNAVGAQCEAAFDANGVANCPLATVPAGHTLVIETVTCRAALAIGAPLAPVFLIMGGPPIGGGNPISLYHSLLLTKASTGEIYDNYGITAAVKMYAAAQAFGSTDVGVNMQVGQSTANFGGVSCAISGYLVAQ